MESKTLIYSVLGHCLSLKTNLFLTTYQSFVMLMSLSNCHGEGGVDGIGGTVKCDVWMATLCRKIIVHSLDDFFVVAKTLSHNIEIEKVISS